MKIRTTVLRERAQLKCTCACRKSDFMRLFLVGMPQTKAGTRVLCKLPQSECTWTCHTTNFIRKYCAPKTRKNCALACALESRELFDARIWKTMRQIKFTGQTLSANPRARNAHGRVKRNNCMQKCARKTAGKHIEHPDQAPAFTLTVRTIGLDRLLQQDPAYTP